MARSKPSQPPLGWEKLIYTNDENEACVDLIVDEVKVHYAIPDLVSLVYHGPRPINHVSRVIDTSKPSTPDNVGWISKDAAVPDPRDGLTTKKIKRRVIRPKMSVKFDKLFCLNDDGELYLPGEYDGQWKTYLISDYLSENYRGPWPAQESYAFIIDMSKPIRAINVAWMTQNPAYRTVYG